MNSLEKIYSKNPDIVFRKIADECILVPIRHRVGDLEGIYALNEVAARSWELIDGKRKVEGIKEIMLNEFEVDSKDLEKDLRGLLNNLEELGFIIKIS
jgi:hypothetical protein